MDTGIENRLKMLLKENPFIERNIKRLESLKKASSQNFNEGQYAKLISLHKMINKNASKSKINLSMLETFEMVIKKLHIRYDKYDLLTKPIASIDLTGAENTPDILILSSDESDDSDLEIVEISNRPQRLSPVADTDRPASSNAVKSRDVRNDLGRSTQMRRPSTNIEVLTGVETTHFNTKEITNADKEDTRTHFRKTQRVGALGQYITHYDSNGNQLPILLCQEQQENRENQHQNSTTGKDSTSISPDDQWPMFATSNNCRRQSLTTRLAPTTTHSQEQPSLTELLEKLRQCPSKSTLGDFNEKVTAQPLRNITKRRATLSAATSHSEDNDWLSYEHYGGDFGSSVGIGINTTPQPLRNAPIRRQSFSYAVNHLNTNRYNTSIIPAINYNDPRVRIAHMQSTDNYSRPSIYQQYANAQSVPTKQHANTQSVPTQQCVSTQTVPTQQYGNAQFVPAQHYANTQTVPSQHGNAQAVSAQQYDNTQTVPTQQYASNQAVPSQQHGNAQAVPAQLLMPTAVLIPTAVPLSNMMYAYQQDYYKLTLRQDPRLHCGVYSQCPNAANVVAIARTQKQQLTQPRTYLEYKQAKARAEALQKERQLKKSRFEFSQQKERESYVKAQQNNNYIYRDTAHDDARANYPKDVANANKEQVEQITKTLGQLDTLVNYLDTYKRKDEAGKKDVNTANVEQVAEQTVEPTVPMVDSKISNDNDNNDDANDDKLLEITAEQPLAKDKTTERRPVGRPKSVNRIVKNQKKAQHRAIATEGIARRGRDDKSNSSEENVLKDVQLTIKPFTILLKRLNLSQLEAHQLHGNKRKHSELEAAESEDDVSLRSRVKRASTKRNLAIANELDVIKFNEEAPLVALKNDQPLWHSMSKWTKVCIICDIRERTIATHYIQRHAEYYSARLLPNILKKVKQGQMNKPTHIVASNIVKCFYRCPFCLNAKRWTMQSWFEHFLMHTGEYKYQCSKCRLPQNRLATIQSHVKTCGQNAKLIKHNMPSISKLSKVKAHVCHLCNYIQLCRSNLDRHFVQQHGYSKDVVAILGYTVFLLTLDNVPSESKQNADEVEKELSKLYKREFLIINAEAAEDEQKGTDTIKQEDLELLFNDDIDDEVPVANEVVNDVADDDVDDEANLKAILADVDSYLSDDNISMTFDEIKPINITTIFSCHDSNQDSKNEKTEPAINVKEELELQQQEDSQQKDKQSPQQQTEEPIKSVSKNDIMKSATNPTYQTALMNEYIPSQHSQTEKPTVIVYPKRITDESQEKTQKVTQNEVETPSTIQSIININECPPVPPEKCSMEVGNNRDEIEKASTSQSTVKINKCPQVPLEKRTVEVSNTEDEWIDMELLLEAKSRIAGFSNDASHMLMSTTIKDLKGNEEVTKDPRFQTIQVRRLPGDCLSSFK